MARYTGPVCRLCRREGLKLYLKGDRCNTGKCSVVKREKAGAPGQHGTTRKKQSEYGTQLREKQKAKRIYGVLEKQFRNYFTAAERMKGVTGENLLRLLELRLDNVVYRLGYGRSRAEARQVVLQGHIKVNGRKVNIASYRVKQGDKLEVKEKSVGLDRFKLIIDGTDFRIVPEWLNADHQNLKGEVLSLPTRDQIKEPIEETYIVELYSK